jgi:hypothetical protein
MKFRFDPTLPRKIPDKKADPSQRRQGLVKNMGHITRMGDTETTAIGRGWPKSPHTFTNRTAKPKDFAAMLSIVNRTVSKFRVSIALG